MKFTAVVIALATTILPALAAPAPEALPEAAGELEKRADFSVFVCEHAGFNAPCNLIFPPFNICQPFSATGLTGYQSWGPGVGTICLWYTGASCTGTQSDYVVNPGWSTVPEFWQFNTASFKCFT
ncbi:hypothetical protein FPV67DRAFT_1669025 [Lyophyllum atratum]|nr:hypothetical protein FPV67DRAFT_1669025 [Lyophyllum atratum]